MLNVDIDNYDGVADVDNNDADVDVDGDVDINKQRKGGKLSKDGWIGAMTKTRVTFI